MGALEWPCPRAKSFREARNGIGLTSPDQDYTPVAILLSLSDVTRLARVMPGTDLSVHLVYILTELSYPAGKWMY